MEIFFAPASQEHQKKERRKAAELKKTAWWKQQKGQGKCYHCGQRFAPQELTMDHKIPIVRSDRQKKLRS